MMQLSNKNMKNIKLSNSNENVLIRVLDIDELWRKDVYIGIRFSLCLITRLLSVPNKCTD